MSHFAKVENGIVARVIVAEQEYVDSLIETVPGFWVQTSYNTRGGVHYEANSNTPSADQSKALRKNFAGVGYTYDAGRDAFIPPKPFDSWVLNEDTCLWDAPTVKPEDGKFYSWNEATLSWIEAGSI